MSSFNIPAIILSALLGALAMSLVREPQLPISGLISATATFAIGWWIHRAVRRRGELDRIPIDYLSDLNRRINELISACLGPANAEGESKRLVNLTLLSNEIHWLRIIANRVQPKLRVQPRLNQLGDELASHYVDFKRHLTESDSVDLVAASNASHEIRMTALMVQWRICRHILDRKTDIDIFTSL